MFSFMLSLDRDKDYINPSALRKAKFVHNFGLSVCIRVELVPALEILQEKKE